MKTTIWVVDSKVSNHSKSVYLKSFDQYFYVNQLGLNQSFFTEPIISMNQIYELKTNSYDEKSFNKAN